MEEKIEFYKETEFKDTEIGKIPKEWEVVKLGSIAKILSGNTAPQEEKYFKNGRNPFIRVQHLKRLQEGKFPVNYDFINDYALSELKLKLFKKGCIIFPKSGESIKLEKRAMLKEDSYVVNHLAVIEPIYGSVDNLFLFYYLRKIKTSDYLTETTTPSLKLSTISNFLVPLPPLIEQQKIAEILSNVDEAIQKTDDIIANTERLKKGLMQELLTKGIGHKEFKDTEIGRIPKEWEVKKLKEIAEQMYYGLSVSGVETPTQYKLITTTSINKETFKIDEGKVPFCNLFTNEDKQTKKLAKYFVKKEDVLVSRSGTTGVVILVDKDYKNMLFGSYLIKIKLNLLIDPKFFWYFSQSLFYWRQISSRGATIKNINLPILKNLQVPLPSLAEQQKVSEILSSIDEKLENLRREKTTLEKIKQWFMDVLLTGKIRVIT